MNHTERRFGVRYFQLCNRKLNKLRRSSGSKNGHSHSNLFRVFHVPSNRRFSKIITCTLYDFATIRHFYLEGGEFAEGTNKIRLVCNGRPCAQCFQCRDWHFEGDEETWTWISNYRKWNDEDEDRWYSDAVYECFTKRDDAMCKFSGYNNDAYSSNGYLLHGGYGVSHGNVYDHSCVCEKH
ncbi:unnamed protein product [Rotaria socialis]|uniref:Uncharacterized protein n=1 Tax=Rotaria socialis TaxID=392032 RepID=A0A821DDW3_9BILA|nr:unnamed protein product [Rotaria socialis]